MLLIFDIYTQIINILMILCDFVFVKTSPNLYLNSPHLFELPAFFDF